MSKHKRKMPQELASAQRDLSLHRAALGSHAGQIKEQVHRKLASKGMLVFAAGTGFLLADFTRPSPVVVAPDATEKQKKQAAKRRSVKPEGDSTSNGKAKSGVEKIDDLIRTSLHLMAWARTFQSLASKPQDPDG